MKLKKGDMLILVIALLALLSYVGIKNIYKSIDDKAVTIYVEGKEYQRINIEDLKEEQFIHIDLDKGRFIDIIVNKDGAYVKDVICPDRLCVKIGVITNPGESIVCLPNKVQVYMEGRKANNDVDNVSY